MGEYAYYALDEIIDFECWFADNYLEDGMEEYSDREPNLLFDYNGILTADAIDSQLKYFECGLSGNQSHMLYGNRYTPISEAPRQQLSVEQVKAKYKVKYNMMFGMIKTIYEGGTLSTKQAKWMETNWEGGTERLIYEMLDQTRAREIMDKVSKITQWVNGD